MYTLVYTIGALNTACAEGLRRSQYDTRHVFVIRTYTQQSFLIATPTTKQFQQSAWASGPI